MKVTGTFSAGYISSMESLHSWWWCPKVDFEFPFCGCGCVGAQNGITLSGGADAIVDANNESIDLTQISSQTGVHVARIKKGSIPIAEYVLDFRLGCGGYAGNVFANNPTNFNANTGDQKAYAHPTGGYRTVNNSSGYVLFVPKSVSHDSVRTCSGAITLGCTAANSWSFVANDQGTITSTNGGFDTTGISVSVSNGYWNIAHLRGTGGEGENSGAGGGNSVPEFSVIGLLMVLTGCGYFMRKKILK